MSTFLDHIVNDIQQKDLSGLKNRAYVFPSRRACVFFREQLRLKFPESTFWSPSVYSIDDFIIMNAQKQVADELSLVLELYTVYKKHQPDITIDDFYPWGQILLQDFDEADRYMADVGKLYQSLEELREIEEAFGDTEEVREALRQFNKVLNPDEPTQLVKKFSATWRTVSKVYHQYRQHLLEKELAYQGMLYREIAERLTAGENVFNYERIVLAGFNALSAAEETIFDYIIQNNLGTVYWDADRLYLEDHYDEAGTFLRKYIRKWPHEHSKWITEDIKSGEKEIDIIGTAYSIGQAKIAGNLLKALPSGDHSNTAVVLADEDLLFPVLYALPDSVSNVNVTMGYPLRKTALHNLVKDFFRLHIHKRGRAEKTFFQIKDLIQFLSNPLLRTLYRPAGSVAGKLKEGRTPWIIRTDIENLLEDAHLQLVFTSNEKGRELLVVLQELLVRLHNACRRDGTEMEMESSYHYIKNLQRISDLLDENNFSPDAKLTYRLVDEIVRSVRIPFEGEPLTGLQVMGFLETRMLDFENVIVLSVNENKVPAGKSRITYIPYNLRKAFKLPTFEDQDAIYAYHFKRLLQRAKRAFILYDTEMAVDGSGEKSRYILQLQHALKEASGIKLQDKVIDQRLNVAQERRPITVEKTENVIGAMEKYLRPSENGRSALSPTMLSTYIECPLRFYFRHIARLPEPYDFSEDIDAREFGLIVHRVLENIYEDFQGKEITAKLLKDILKESKIEGIVDQVYRDENLLSENQLPQGRNLLNKSVVVRLVTKVLQNDLRQTPFRLISIENRDLLYTLEVGDTRYPLGGTIDRIDIDKDGFYRIIDYKTGITKFITPYIADRLDLSEYVESYFENSYYKTGFQGYYYALLFHRNHPSAKLKVGIYGLKEINKGIQYLRNRKEISPALLDTFEARLKGLISEIFDPGVPFIETEDARKCRYCAYKAICAR